VTTGFVVLGVAAWLLRRPESANDGRRIFRMALGFLTVFVPLQIFLGDMHGLNTAHYQPAKLAAIEGRWDTAAPAPLTVIGWPEQSQERTAYAVEIPVLGSLILTHSTTGEIRGLKSFPADQRPPVAPVFFAFRIMVGLGMLMLLTVCLAWFLRWRKRLYDNRWFLTLCMWMAPSGFLAVLAGWTTTEVGRQPWTVYGILRTAHSVTPSLSGPDVLLSFLAYAGVYLIMFPAGIAVMAKMVRQGPSEAPTDSPVKGLQPSAPIHALAEKI